jgi:hypothetical protein
MSDVKKLVTTTTNELLVDGHHLIEKKQETRSHVDGIAESIVELDVRTIDDKSHKVITVYPTRFEVRRCGVNPTPDRQVYTEMTEDEVMQFEEDWASLWNPDIVKNEIEKFHRQ